MALFKRTRRGAKPGFLARLGRDTRGNVLAMTAAAVVPMIGVVGGAIDASRLYLVRSRLQAACDSAVLAGRKAMSTATYDTAAQARADAMFNFNFQDSDFQTSGTSFVDSADGNGRVSGTATTSVPMTLMRIFGFGNQTASVTCSADLQIPNIDIVFVLDVTGSMAWDLGSTTRIAALKTAAKNFYTTLKAQLDANGANAGQVRYGFVPYSQAVNGLDLFKASPNMARGELPLSHLADTVVVQSRVANFADVSGPNRWIDDPNSGPVTLEQRYSHTDNDTIEPYRDKLPTGTVMSNNDCENYSQNKSFLIDSTGRQVWLYPSTSWPGNAGIGDSTLFVPEGSSIAQTDEPTTGNFYWAITFSRKSGTWEDSNGTKYSKYQTCTRYVTWTKFIKNVPQYKFTNWTYKPVSYTAPSYKSGATISYASAVSQTFTAPGPGPYTPLELAAMSNTTGLTLSSFSWNGCLEERDTLAANTFTPIPSGALDLNVILGGTSTSTRWRPIMDDITYNRRRTGEITTTTSYSVPSHNCPSARMRNLNPMTQTEFNSYIDSLSPQGSTYLDVGMVWGLRLIAPQGLFGSRNLTGPNGGQISRHIIFMTDGEMAPTLSTYSAYGVEEVARRVTGNLSTSQETLHLRRFQALCDLQRGTVSIWAIALATDVEAALRTCADPGRAYQADDATELNNAFAAIARDIADLRLVS